MPEARHRSSLGDITHVVSVVLLGVALALAACALAGFLLRDGSGFAFLLSALVVAAAGGLGRSLTHVPEDLNYREGFASVSLAWIAVALAGALPYLFSGAIVSPLDAIFESVSGFTTTGATILGDVESVQPGILLWRSVSQWLGGMGIIVLGVAVLPYLRVGGMQLFRAEFPGPTKDRLRPRVQESAKLLWFVYAGLTLLLIGLYLAGGMGFFDAVNHALTTLPTGGFSTRNDSLAAFGPFVQWVTVLFMYLAGINFILHYRALTRGALPYWRDSEWRFYTAVAAAAIVMVGVAIHAPGTPLEPTARAASFQALAILSTTGFYTADWTLWVPFAQVALFLLFFIGGMAGSTSGGPKAVRVLLILKHGFGEMRRYLHPQAVLVTKLGKVPVERGVMLNIFAFMILYVGIFGVGTLVMSATGLSLTGAAGAAGAALSNVGPALAELGPVQNFGFLVWWGKIALMLLMLVGRLEIYTVLLLLHPGLWRRR